MHFLTKIDVRDLHTALHCIKLPLIEIDGGRRPVVRQVFIRSASGRSGLGAFFSPLCCNG